MSTVFVTELRAFVYGVYNNSISVDTYGTLSAEWTDEKLIALINYNFDLRYISLDLNFVPLTL